MVSNSLEERIVAMGERALAEMRRERSSLYNRSRGIGKVLHWCLENEDFKNRFFRFIEVFPDLGDAPSLNRHLREYFDRQDESIPALFRGGSRFTGFLGDYLFNRSIDKITRNIARHFFVGEAPRESVEALACLREQGFGMTVNLLGEIVVSEEEARHALNRHLDLLAVLDEARGFWRGLGGGASLGGLDWGLVPPVNLSIKPNIFYSQIRPENFEESVEGVISRVGVIYERLISMGGFLCLDMASSGYKNLTLEIFRRLRLRYRDYPHLGITLQSYLKETDQDLDLLLDWARKNELSLSIRLVKGSYREQELAAAKKDSHPIPVYTRKAETDAAFERQARRILEHHDFCSLACGSHNLRAVMMVLETARSLGASDDKLEFQMLHGMAEPVAKGVQKYANRVRIYSPVGGMAAGINYLMRRLLEAVSAQSFLRRGLDPGEDIPPLLVNPLEILAQSSEPKVDFPEKTKGFANEPSPDFGRQENREAMAEALSKIRKRLGETCPFTVNGRDLFSRHPLLSYNPARPGEIVGRVCQAGGAEVREAVGISKAFFPAWRDRHAGERTVFLRKAADAARGRFFELAAWQVLEIGKQWRLACAEVSAAIDFLEYYAHQMEHIQAFGRFSEAENRFFCEGKGVAAVIAPWCRPLSIGCGMIAAALAAGNSVVYKPSEKAPLCGRLVFELFVEAGLPAEALHYVPGTGPVVGEILVSHPDISLVVFTGSTKTGLQIIEKASRLQPGQKKIKQVIAAMGGKNAIIIDEDAAFDMAVPAVLESAFSYQGQDCAACSRLILPESIHDSFLERLIQAARSLRVGPAENPAHFLGPVIDDQARKKVMDFMAIGKKEGTLLYLGEPAGEGHHLPMAVFGGIQVHHRLAQEEIFGPLLVVMKVKDLDQAIEFGNASSFALAGGFFSRSPSHIEQVQRRFQVGNLFINSALNIARPGKQPFGGYKLSGLGTRVGGPDDLLNFLETKIVCENTLRSGFAP